MDTIDKQSIEYLNAVDASMEVLESKIENPPDQSVGTSVDMPKRRKRPEEVQFFLKSNTLSILERLHNIATDQLYYRDDNHQRQRTMVPPGVQLQAAIAFLDRAMGKPTVAVDLTVSERPIVFDPAFNQEALIQGHGEADEAEVIE